MAAADKAIDKAEEAIKTGSPVAAAAAAAAAVNSAKNAQKFNANSKIAKSAAKAAEIAVSSIAPSGGPMEGLNGVKYKIGEVRQKIGDRLRKGVDYWKNTFKSFSFNPEKWKERFRKARNERMTRNKELSAERRKEMNIRLDENKFRGITRRTVARRRGKGFFSAQRRGAFLGKMQNRFRAMRWRSNGQTYKQRFNALQDAREDLWNGVKAEVIAEIQEKVKDLGTRKMEDLSSEEKNALQDDVNSIVKKINVLHRDEREKVKKILQERYQPQLRSIKDDIKRIRRSKNVESVVLADSLLISYWFIWIVVAAVMAL